MAEHFKAGDLVPSEWYEAPNLHPFRFGVDVMVEMVASRRNIMPAHPLGQNDVVVRSDGAVDPKQDSPVTTDPPWNIHTV